VWFNRDPLSAEFGQECIGVSWVVEAESDVSGRWIAAQFNSRHVWQCVRGAELMHCARPRDKTAFWNRDLVGKGLFLDEPQITI